MINSVQNHYLKSLYNSNKKNDKSSEIFTLKTSEGVKISKEDDERISKEEDAILWGKLIASGYDSTTHNFDDFKKTYDFTFPPYNAPGHVRRAWRQVQENASPELKKEMKFFTVFYGSFLSEQTDYMSKMDNSIDGYSKMIQDMRTYAEEYNDPQNAQSRKQYKEYLDVLKCFEDELGKYL